MSTHLQALEEKLGANHRVYPEVVYFEDYKLPELAALLARTKVLLHPHGAGMSNLIFMRKGTVCLCYFLFI
jgi:capsular polysaccharide biosynthesis protein